MPKRVCMTRHQPWRRDNPDAVIVDRRTRFGNPYPVCGGDRQAAVDTYAQHMAARPDLAADAKHHLAGRDLACWCPTDQPCHADVLLAIANT